MTPQDNSRPVVLELQEVLKLSVCSLGYELNVPKKIHNGSLQDRNKQQSFPLCGLTVMSRSPSGRVSMGK